MRRLRRRVFRLSGAFLARPIFRVGIIIAFFALVSSWLLWLVERKSSSAYETYYGTVQQVGILLFSGFDVDPPKEPSGYGLAMFCLFLGFGLLALLTADLASLLVSMALIGAGHVQVRAKRHVVIHEWHYTTRVLIDLLTNQNDGPQREVVVIDDGLRRLPVYDPDVYLVHGDPTDVETLSLARLERAETAIVPIDWKLQESLQDARTTLAVMAIKSVNPSLYTCAEVLRPRNKDHVDRTGVDEVVCLGLLSERILSQAALTHGLGELMERLLSFSSDSEIYRIPVPDELAGHSFRWLLRRLNKKRQSVLLAVQRGDAMYTNPRGEFLLEMGDQLFLLAPSYPEDISTLTSE